jgi:acyl carrier protein
MESVADAMALVKRAIQMILPNGDQELSPDTPLIGSDRALDSMNLVELCLMLEDASIELGFDFDWTSSEAMSKSQSMFRTVSSLAEEFYRQMNSTS